MAPPAAAKLPQEHKLAPEEVALFQAVNTARNALGKASWKMNPSLNDMARDALGGGRDFVQPTRSIQNDGMLYGR